MRLQRRFGKAITSNIAIGAMTLSFLTAAAAWVSLLQLPAGETLDRVVAQARDGDGHGTSVRGLASSWLVPLDESPSRHL